MDGDLERDTTSDGAALLTRLSQLETAVASIQQRNLRVEREKAWEVSQTRKAAIVIVTYLLMWLVFIISGVEAAWFNAVIPTAGYFLSTQSLPFLRNWWIGKAAPASPGKEK